MPRGGARPGAGRPRKTVVDGGAAPPLPTIGAAPSLRAALATEAPPAAPHVAPDTSIAPLPEAAPSESGSRIVFGRGWAKWVATIAAEKFDQFAERRVLAQGLIPGERDEDNVKTLAETTEAMLTEHFPEVSCPSWVAVPMAAMFVYLDRRMGAQPLPAARTESSTESTESAESAESAEWSTPASPASPSTATFARWRESRGF